MKNILLAILMILSFYTQSHAQNNEVLPNAIRVKFQNSINLPSTQNEFTSSANGLLIGNQIVDQLNSKYRATNMKRVFPYAGKFEKKHQKYGLHLWYDIFVAEGSSVQDLQKEYGNLEIVSIAEPIAVYSHEDIKGEILDANDPQLQNQWHYDNYGQSGGTASSDISLLNAWDQETGDSRVVVSVHDSGIDTDHPDLNDHLWVNSGEIPNDNIDNDNNGYIDDYHGYNFAAAVVGGDPSSVEDYGGHGTHTSGTIAAENNNEVGVAGVAGGSGSGDGVRIMMMRLGDDNGSNSIYNPAPSFIYAADMGAVISSNSWGGGSYDQSIIDAISYFTAEAGGSGEPLDGGLVIFSSGNGDSSYPDYKSDLNHLLMVSASNHNDQKAWYSNYGSWVDITAPGGETSIQSQGVLSTLPGPTYGYYQGTSMACPHVTGVAALLVSKANGTGLTNSQLEEALLSTTDPIDQLNPSYAGLLGSGRLNAEAALDAVTQGSGSSGDLLIDPIEINAEINEGESETFSLKIVNTSEYQIDVDIETTEDWISASAANLTLAPNGVGKFTVELNSANIGDFLNGQIKFSYLSFNSNTTSILPVSVYTLGEPDIESVDTLDFGTNYIGYENTQLLEIVNSGTNYLTITEAINFSDDYEITFSGTTLAPSASIEIPVTFTASQAGALIDSILFTSNDPDQPTYKVILSGEGNTLSPPQIGLNPEEIYIELLSATYDNSSFTISNEGDEGLSYSIVSNPADIVPLEEYSDSYVKVENGQPVQDGGSYNGVGNLVSHQKNPVNLEQGLAWDGEHLWIKEFTNSTIYRYDVDLQVMIDSIESIATSISRLDFYDGYLWEHDQNNQIIQYDLDGNVIAQIETPDQIYFSPGIAVDQDGIWLNASNDFVLINTNGEIEDQFRNYDAYNLDSFETIGNKIYGIRGGRLIAMTKFSNYDDFYSNYIGGHYLINTVDIAFDGENAWTSYINHGVLVEFEPFENFISYYYPSSGFVNSGESINVNFNYNLYPHLEGFNFNDVFRIQSNDLDNPIIDLPVSALITGSPQIDVSESFISFDSYIGIEAVDTVTMTNVGAAPLLISSITSSLPDFTFSFTETELSQYQSLDLPISVLMTNSDTLESILQIVSNDSDPEKDTINVSLVAIGRLAPEISIQPDSLSITLYENQIDSLPITITNSGEGNLFYAIINEPSNENSSSIVSTSETFSDGFILESKDDIAPPESVSFYTSKSTSTNLDTNSSFQTNFTELEDVLTNLEDNSEIITSVLDSRYSFYDGESGYQISDGGGDMYDGGNRLLTDLGGYLYYSNSNIYTDQSYLGGGSYFTAKYDGLFVFAADIEDINSFSINGNLGADGYGSVDGSVLSFSSQGIEWLGFVKRVYNAGDPSVNHLIIVPNNNSVNHSFSTYSDDDMHQLNDLTDISRLHYLLFAGQNGHYYSDESILALMETYIESVEDGSASTPLAPNSSIEEYVIFDSNGLNPSTYEYDVRINSNDPLSSRIGIPTSLIINSRPILSMNPEEAIYDTAFVGADSHVNIMLRNLGSDTLMITDITLSGSQNITLDEYMPDTLTSLSSDYITVILHPTGIESFSSTLSFQTNDPLNSTVEFQINGYGKASSILSVNPYLTTDTLSINGSADYSVDITNNGTLPLDYRIVVEETYPTSYFVDQIEEIWKKSGILDGPVTYPSYENSDGTIVPSQTIVNREQIAAYQTSSGANRILLLGSEYSYQSGYQVLNELQSTGNFGFIAYINPAYSQLTYSLLKEYDAVLIWDDNGYRSPSSLGDILAEYVDNGGGVVTALWENAYRRLQGRWNSEYEKYSLYNSQDFSFQYGYDNAFIASSAETNHELLNNVDTLKSGYYGLRTNATPEQISSEAEIIASWSDGTPAVIVSSDPEVRRVDLGFYPGSSLIKNDSWDSSSDGSQLVVNAIRYVSNGISGSEVNWLEASSYQESDQAAGESREITFSVNADDIVEGIIGARAKIYSNDSRNQTIPAYFEITVDGTSDLAVPNSLDFEEVTLGFAETKKLSITNQGDGQAQFTIQLDTLSKYSLDYSSGDTLSIGSFERVNLNVYLDADSIGSFSDIISISNLSDEGEFEVELLGEVVPPGSIRIEPSIIDLTVDYQSETQSQFTIHNDGEGDLNFFMPAFYSLAQVDNQSINNTEYIEFSNTPNKGQDDTRNGHPVISGLGFDNFGYSYIDSTEPESPSYSWNDITESGTLLTLGDDEVEEVIFDFEFPFYGLRKSSIFVSSNGLLSFLESGATSPINNQFPQPNSPNSLIAPFWKDLSPNNGGSIHYLTDSDKVIVQYTDVPDYEASGTFTFQAIIYRTGDIAFLYETMNGNLNDASIGLENDFGNTGLQIAFNSEYVSNNFGVYISYPQPQINPEMTSGSIIPGDSLIIPFTYNALSDLGGIYSHELAVSSNDAASVISIVDITVEVIAPTLISAFNDTLLFDTTYVNRVSSEQLWFRNDSIGTLIIDELNSSNPDFLPLFPVYEAKSDSDTTDFSIHLRYYANSESISGVIYGLPDNSPHLKLYRREGGQRKLIGNISINQFSGGYRIDFQQVLLEDQEKWLLAQEELYVDIFSTEHPAGVGEISLKKESQRVSPESYSYPFQLLYSPTEPTSDTTALTVVSNAINTDEVRISGFGTGISSDASIEISHNSIEETLAVSDSTQQFFTITNTGTDTLNINLSTRNFSYESNKDPIQFSQANTKNELSVKKDLNENKYLIPSTSSASSIDTEEIQINELSRDYYGVVYHSGYEEFAQIFTNQYLYVDRIISVSYYDFTMASEFLPGSKTEILNLSISGQIYTTDLENGSVSSFGYPINGDDDWVGLTASRNPGYFYASTRKSLYRLNVSSFEVELIGSYGLSSMIGIAMTQSGQLYGYDLNDQFFEIDPLTGKLTYIGHIGFDANYGQDLAYDQESNQLIMSAFNATTFSAELRSVDIQTGATELIGEIGPNLNGTVQGASIAFFNDISSYFLDLDQRSASIAPGESSEISVWINAENLANGKHTADIQILSNDFSNPKIEIPVSLSVTGNNAIVGFYTDKINYGLHIVKSEISETITIENTGREVLTLVLEENADPFLCDYNVGDTLKIDIVERESFEVIFRPQSADVFDQQMVWSTNDPEMPEIAIQLSAASERSAKELSLGFEEFYSQLPRSTSHEISLEFHSVGQDSVSFTLIPYDSASWLTIDTLSSILAPDSMVSAPITVNTEGLEMTLYESTMLLVSDDPMYDSLIIPISIDVINQPIELLKPIADELIGIGEIDLKLFLEDYFHDEDGDSIIYEINSTNGSVGISHNGSRLVVSSLQYGLDTVQIEAIDQFGDTLTTSFEVMVNNRPTSIPFGDVFRRVDESLIELFDLDEYFTDSDGNSLTFTLEQSELIADIFIDSENKVIVKTQNVGSTKVTVNAFDGYHYRSATFQLTIGNPLGIKEEIEASFQLYPVPVSDILTVSFSAEKKGTYEFRVVSLTGKVIITHSLEDVSGSLEKQIDVSDIQSGYYLFQVFFKGESILTRDFIRN